MSRCGRKLHDNYGNFPQFIGLKCPFIHNNTFHAVVRDTIILCHNVDVQELRVEFSGTIIHRDLVIGIQKGLHSSVISHSGIFY